MTTFHPQSNGYAFPNRFLIENRSKFGSGVSRRFVYGLCGGMTYSALDYYFRQTPLPHFTDPEDLPENFKKYLVNRQVDSLPVKSLFKLVKMLFMNDHEVFKHTILSELPIIFQEIHLEHPVPIVVIRTKYFENLTQNHQMTIYGYDQHQEVTNLFCYDPNHPGKEVQIEVGNNHNHSLIRQSSGELVRGLFVNRYQLATLF